MGRFVAAGSESFDSNDIFRNNRGIRTLLVSQMINLIELATGKLNDPILTDWVNSRYWQLEKCYPQLREGIEHDWFGDLTLYCWLDSDNEVQHIGINPSSKVADLVLADEFSIPYSDYIR